MPKRGSSQTFLYMPISDAWEMDCTLGKPDEGKWRIPAHAINSKDVLLSKE